MFSFKEPQPVYDIKATRAYGDGKQVDHLQFKDKILTRTGKDDVFPDS